MADSVATNDLGLLQQDLENLLSILNHKYSVLRKKQSITIPTEKKDENLTPPPAPALIERKLSLSEERPLKKIKISNEKSSKLNSRAKNKRSAKIDFGISEKSSELPKTQKNDNRFWSYTDSYCADISNEHIKMLERWIESHENDFDHKTIPPMGVHYSVKWMEDDLMEEVKEGSKAVENPKGIDCESMEDQPYKELLQKVEDENFSDHSGPPPLLQNLISSLVRENFITSSNEVMSEAIPEEESPSETPLNELKSTSQHPEDTLENRLLKELFEFGVSESKNLKAENELLLDLKKLQSLLIPVSRYNLLKKEKLTSRVKTEMVKQESQTRIQEADAKVMESFRTMSAARKKDGKKLNKKELFQIRTVLEEREKILKSSRLMNSFEMCSGK